MSTTITHEIAVCECCALVVANADDSACRDYYGHTHAESSLPASACLTGDEDQPATPWTCEACRAEQGAYATRTWVAVLEPQHRHEYRRDLADWWCRDCQTVTDYCTQTNPF